MLRHVVMWKFKDEAEGRSKAENLSLVQENILALIPLIPQIQSLQVGIDTFHTPASYDLVLIGDFADREALETYINHPEHQKVGAYTSKVVASRIAVDFLV